VSSHHHPKSAAACALAGAERIADVAIPAGAIVEVGA
jgi:hypothetical protein